MPARITHENLVAFQLETLLRDVPGVEAAARAVVRTAQYAARQHGVDDVAARYGSQVQRLAEAPADMTATDAVAGAIERSLRTATTEHTVLGQVLVWHLEQHLRKRRGLSVVYRSSPNRWISEALAQAAHVWMELPTLSHQLWDVTVAAIDTLQHHVGPAPVRLYRGIRHLQDDGPAATSRALRRRLARTPMRVLSSWTTEQEMAESFTGNGGYVMTADVPAGCIVASPSVIEHEILVAPASLTGRVAVRRSHELRIRHVAIRPGGRR